jgi:hypothetical protein
MVVDCCEMEACGEGDLGGLESRGGASTGGSSTTVVVCEGVWLRDEAWVTVGDTGGGDVACARGEAECWFLLSMLLSPWRGGLVV